VKRGDLWWADLGSHRPQELAVPSRHRVDVQPLEQRLVTLERADEALVDGPFHAVKRLL
jgi:hypothetical protein